MMMNKHVGFENSCFKFGVQVLRCLLKVNVLRLLANRKKKLSTCDFPLQYEANSARNSCKII